MSADTANISTSARTSKTWVLPPRAKPGRKSKKVQQPAILRADDDDDLDDTEMDKASSRIKQKASRERKQEYIAELEGKLRNYEQGEGERATFFQNLAKRHSEENDALRVENELLRARLAALEARTIRDAGPAFTASVAVTGLNTQSLTAPFTSTSVSHISNHLRKPSLDNHRTKRQRTRSISVSSAASSSSTHTASAAIYLSSSTQIDPIASWQSNHGAHPQSSQRFSVPATTTVSQYTNSLSPASSSSHQPKPMPPSASSVFSPLPPSSVSLPASSKAANDDPGCGICDKAATGNCICDDIGIRAVSSYLPGSSAANGSGESLHPPNAALVLSSTADSGKQSCGLCTETGDCLCEDLGLGRPQASGGMRAEIDPSVVSISACVPLARQLGPVILGSNAGTSALPLRLRSRNPTTAALNRGKVWRIDNVLALSDAPTPQVQTMQPPNLAAAAAGVALRRKLIKVGSRLPCSGDPKTCPACADDPAGQAFCSALSNTVCTSGTPCATCPNRPSPLSHEVKGSGPPQSQSDSQIRSSTPAIEQRARVELRRRDSSARDEVPQAMVPCSDAWATLREHPNIGFANLDLLANVVARRTTCLGEKKDKNGKIIEVNREGIEEALDMLDHVRDGQLSPAL